MADNPFKKYLDAGVAFTALTQARAEAIVKDLVRAGEVQAEQAQAAATDLLDRSRKNTEALVKVVRKEVGEQVRALGLVGQAEIARLEKRIEALTGTDAATALRKVAGKKAPAGKAAPAKPAATEAAPAKKTAAKKAPKKAAPVKKTATRKAPAKKAPAKKASATKAAKTAAPARKAPAPEAATPGS